MDAPESKSLPENAYLPLPPGESYRPMVSPDLSPPEASFRAVAWGLFLCLIFTVASAYSGLKVGQVMEASVPISILAIGLARMYSRRSHLLENVIMTNIGGTSGGMVAGAVFTIPALYILRLDPRPLQTTLILIAGGSLGVLFLIPLRRYFVREMHGAFPYPEATAITEVLVTGERGGSQAKLLLQATGISAVYDLLVTTFQVWREVIDLQFLAPVRMLGERARMAMGFDALSFILGLGYVMGLRSSMVLCAGGLFANWILVPLVFFIGQHHPEAIYPGTAPIETLTAMQIFRSYVRFVGVGAIATAGIFGIVKSLKILWGSLAIAARTFKQGEDHSLERTDRDLPMMQMLIGLVVATLLAGIFYTTLGTSLPVALIGLALTLAFSFFFASVAANAIATTARNPVSGMTMLTIIVASAVLLKFGLSGTTGMFFVMAIAAMVCTALSVSGQVITDLKMGYWLGSTPATQLRVKFLGVAVSAIAASVTIMILAQAFQFGEAVPGDVREVLVAPQASIMAALTEGFMSQQPVAYVLFAIGALVALVMEMIGAPALLFALGMYLPLELNTPALVGGVLHHYVTKRSNGIGGEEGRGLRERGIIIASGLMAGGALGGVFGAALRLVPSYRDSWIKSPFFDHEPAAQLVSAALFLALCVYLWIGATRRPKAG